MTINRQVITAAVDLATEAAELAPEAYSSIVFAEVLRSALRTSVGVRQESAAHDRNGGDRPQQKDSDSDWPEPHEVADGTRAQQTVWAVWRLTSEGIPATNEAIRERIRTQLSIQPQHPNNTSRTLGDLTPRYLLREDNPAGSGFVYTLSRHARSIFEE